MFGVFYWRDVEWLVSYLLGVCVCLCDAGWVSVCSRTSLGAARFWIHVFLYGGCVLLTLQVLYYNGIEYE